VVVPAALFLYALVVYPAILWLCSRFAPAPKVWADPSIWPSVTILVPAYNEEESIAGTLASLLALDYPADRREIVVMSDASTDRTDDIVRVFAARGVQGIGAALLLPNSLALLNAAFSGEKRGRAVGIWAAAGAAAAAIAPLIGGWLVGTVGWPAIFYINLPLALGAILLALRFVAESREPGAGRTDYRGAALVTGGLGGLTYALTLWSATRHFSTIAMISLAAGLILIAAFLLVEHGRGTRAMMPTSVIP